MTTLLQTKLHIPRVRPELVSRPRLIEQLNAGLPSPGHGLGRRLTLISAPAGFGKTTLLSSWLHQLEGEQTLSPVPQPPSSPAPQPLRSPAQAAWLSLDEHDNDLACFLAYLIAALQTVEEGVGQGILPTLQPPGPVDPDWVLTLLLNEIARFPTRVILVLDDYQAIESRPIDEAVTFLLEHLPPQMHLVIASRIDPSLPLSRLRARGQMAEIREDDLRFSLDEISTFLVTVMGLDLSAEEVAALGNRTEGWIAGLQLAALSMQRLRGSSDLADFVNRFAGSDRYINDYLVDEVFHQRPPGTRDFLLRTSILDRLCAPLCDAVRFGAARSPGSSQGAPIAAGEDSQAILEALETANLFIVPLDNERRWYRYHQLFAELLRQRLHQSALALPAADGGDQRAGVDELHLRASAWYEKHGLEIEALHHAAAANDVERAEDLIEGHGLPLHFRGAAVHVLNWLESLPPAVLDARPSLWVTYAMALLTTGQTDGVEEKLQAAEAALEGAAPDDKTRDLIGRIANTRANLAVGQRQAETLIAQSRRALEYLHPDNVSYRTATTWKLGVAYEFQGDRAAAAQAFAEAVANSRASGNTYIHLLASTGLGNIELAQNELHLADQTYRRVLELVGDLPIPVGPHVHLCLARIAYEWNDLHAAHEHAQRSTQLAQQFQDRNDIVVACDVFLAHLRLARGDVAGAAAVLAGARRTARRRGFAHHMPEVAATQVLVLLQQGNLAAAADLADAHDLPISQARVHLAQGDPSAALAVLVPLRQGAEAKDWRDEWLKTTILEAIAHRALGEKDSAIDLLGEALAEAEPGGFVRIFVDEGLSMANLLSETAAQGIMPDYARTLLAAFDEATKDERRMTEPPPSSSVLRPSSPAVSLSRPRQRDLAQGLVEPLSARELEVLKLVAEGLSNSEIGQRLFIALDTVKGHNRNIYSKLHVHRRTEALARARELGLL